MSSPARCGQSRTACCGSPPRRRCARRRARRIRPQLSAVDRLSDTAIAFSLKVDRPRAELPAGPVREPRGAGHRPEALLLLQLAAGRARACPSWCATSRPGVMSTYLRENGPSRATQLEFTGPAGQLLPARHQSPGAVPGGRHRPGAVPVDARQSRRGRAASTRSTWSTA